jgi:hypothetical protein
VDPTVDAGSYVCSVRGNSGETARREIQLTVNSEYVKRSVQTAFVKEQPFFDSSASSHHLQNAALSMKTDTPD